MRLLVHCIAVFLAGAVLECVCGSSLESYAHAAVAFPAHNQRNTESETQATKKWAERLDLPNVPNLYKVSDDLYRGGQPSLQGFVELKKMGIKTVVSLRSLHSDRNEIRDTELAYERIYMKTWHPEEEDVVRFLKIVTDKKRTPVFVHCKQGADRSGMMCAIYRIAVQGWSKKKAIKEMTEGGFGFHSQLQNIVKYIRHLDVGRIKRHAGLKQ